MFHVAQGRASLLPLWEKVARTSSATDEGSPSAETDPSPKSHLRCDLTSPIRGHKGEVYR